MGRVILRFLAGAAVFAAPALRAGAQADGPSDLRSPPKDPIVAYIIGAGHPWSDDARAAARALLVQALSRSLIPDIDAARMTGRVVAAGLGAGTELRLCVFGLSAEPAPAKAASGAAIQSLNASLEVKTDQAEPVITAIREACLTDTAAAEAKLDGGEGLVGRISGRNWPKWREVGWSASNGLLRMHLGTDAMAPSATDSREHAPATGEMAAALRAQLGSGPGTVEVFVNLNALRRSMPEVFVTGVNKPWLAPVLNGAGIANMRGLLVRVSAPADAGAPLRIDAAWSSRAEPPDSLHCATLTEDRWPDSGPVRPDGAWSVVIAADWERWTAAAMDIRGGIGSSWQQYDWGQARILWFRHHGAALASVISRAAPRLLAWAGPAPGAVDLAVPLSPGSPLDDDLAEVFTSLGAAPAEKGWAEQLGAFGSLHWWREGDALCARFTPGPP